MLDVDAKPVFRPHFVDSGKLTCIYSQQETRSELHLRVSGGKPVQRRHSTYASSCREVRPCQCVAFFNGNGSTEVEDSLCSEVRPECERGVRTFKLQTWLSLMLMDEGPTRVP
jgi:hypothetical protein